jgi:hypothetical protein
MAEEIIITKRFSNKRRLFSIGGTFVVLSFLWQFLEPLGLFKLGDQFFEGLGWKGYLGLLLISILIAIGIEVFNTWNSLRKISLVKLKILIMSSGRTYSVKTPQRIRVDDFLSYFFDYLERKENSEDLNVLTKYFDMHLSLKSGNDFLRLDGNMNLREAGITNGAECRVEVEQKEGRKFYNFIGIIVDKYLGLHNFLVDVLLRFLIK